ncbi:unnamed protein product [Schistocephalus solidus]|uniref:EGF-like domain-containing protein n=1 Tax=Schistocephalus solidus TaxID=70667 RepID=A0A183TFI8_SCHSO|nr:unnamed protein product [Schistocephalus solidus]
MFKPAPIFSQSLPCFAMLICLTLGLSCHARGYISSVIRTAGPARFDFEPERLPQKASKDFRGLREIFDADADAEDSVSSSAGPEVSKRLSLQQQGMLRRIVYEVSHCMRPCLNNGITLLPRNTVDLCRCVCQPGNYGLACEYELTEEEKRLHRYAY